MLGYVYTDPELECRIKYITSFPKKPSIVKYCSVKFTADKRIHWQERIKCGGCSYYIVYGIPCAHAVFAMKKTAPEIKTAKIYPFISNIRHDVWYAPIYYVENYINQYRGQHFAINLELNKITNILPLQLKNVTTNIRRIRFKSRPNDTKVSEEANSDFGEEVMEGETKKYCPVCQSGMHSLRRCPHRNTAYIFSSNKKMRNLALYASTVGKTFLSIDSLLVILF